MVKRLRRSPLKAESGVRFSVGLPKEKAYPNGYAFSFARGERMTKEFGFATVAKAEVLLRGKRLSNSRFLPSVAKSVRA